MDDRPSACSSGGCLSASVRQAVASQTEHASVGKIGRFHRRRFGECVSDYGVFHLLRSRESSAGATQASPRPTRAHVCRIEAERSVEPLQRFSMAPRKYQVPTKLVRAIGIRRVQIYGQSVFRLRLLIPIELLEHIAEQLVW